LKKECGGDDCDDDDPNIKPGKPCYDECYNGSIKKSSCVAGGDGECVYNSTVKCEGGGDPCKLDSCVEVDKGNDICMNDVGPNVCGGIVPCGRLVDNPDTFWKDDVPCNICHAILTIQIIIEFLLKLVGIVALFAISVSGLVYMFSVGDSSRMESAKTAVKYALIGFAAVFAVWLLVSTVFALLGFSDPLGGEWYVVDCDIPLP